MFWKWGVDDNEKQTNLCTIFWGLGTWKPNGGFAVAVECITQIITLHHNVSEKQITLDGEVIFLIQTVHEFWYLVDENRFEIIISVSSLVSMLISK